MRVIIQFKSNSVDRKMWLEPRQSLSFGRTDTADVSIGEDVSLSRVHFRLTNDGDKCILVDQKSTNGTFVNGQLITESIVGDGDEILAGTTRFKLQISDKKFETVSLPMPPELAAGKKRSDLTMRMDPPFAAGNTLAVGTTTTKEYDLPTPVTEPSEHGNDVNWTDVAAKIETRNRTSWPIQILPWQNPRGEFRLTVLVKTSFRFHDQGPLELYSPPIPIWSVDQVYEGKMAPLVKFEADTCPVKPRGDVVLVGSAYAPQGKPVTQLDVKLRVGVWSKTIRVIGDRRWEPSADTPHRLVPGVAEPFTRMSLTYDRAFGGCQSMASDDSMENLAGVGLVTLPGSASPKDDRLPNLERPEDLIVDIQSKPKPVGFGFFGRGWMPRRKYAGNYDLPLRSRQANSRVDYTYDFHNGAHPDLQVEGFLRGDEDVELVNMTPSGHCRLTLPNTKLKVGVVQRLVDGSSGPTVYTRPRLDTLVLAPDDGFVYLLHRAVFPLTNLVEPEIQSVDVSFV